MVALHRLRSCAALVGAVAILACANSAPSRAADAAVAPASAAPTLTTAPDQFFTSDGARVRYREAGRGDAVVLIHGLTRSLVDWVGVGDSLALDHRIIAFDLRGYGNSTRFRNPSDFGSKMADDVVRLLDHLHVTRAHLVGHSLGAAIAADVAVRYPDRVASASLVAGPFRQDTGSFARDDRGFMADIERGAGMTRFFQWLFPGMPDSTASAASAETMAANDPAAITATWRSMGTLMVFPGRAGATTVPALVVVGGQDPLIDQSRWLASWWPHAQLLVVPDANHGDIIRRHEVLLAMRGLMMTRTARQQPGR